MPYNCILLVLRILEAKIIYEGLFSNKNNYLKTYKLQCLIKILETIQRFKLFVLDRNTLYRIIACTTLLKIIKHEMLI